MTPELARQYSAHVERLNRMRPPPKPSVTPVIQAAVEDEVIFVEIDEPAGEMPALPLPSFPTVGIVLDAVCRHYVITRADILSARRTANIVRPRQVAIYLARKLTLQSLPKIGRRFGGRDHTTVLHSIRQIEIKMVADPELNAAVEAIEAVVAARLMAEGNLALAPSIGDEEIP